MKLSKTELADLPIGTKLKLELRDGKSEPFYLNAVITKNKMESDRILHMKIPNLPCRFGDLEHICTNERLIKDGTYKNTSRINPFEVDFYLSEEDFDINLQEPLTRVELENLEPGTTLRVDYYKKVGDVYVFDKFRFLTTAINTLSDRTNLAVTRIEFSKYGSNLIHYNYGLSINEMVTSYGVANYHHPISKQRTRRLFYATENL